MPNINKNIIMQAGAAVANATNKAAGLSAATPEPGSIISVIQLVNGGRTIGPDALIHFTESVRNKLLSLLVSMEPIQDFNGYGNPWPAGGGANRLNPATVPEEGGNIISHSGLVNPNPSWRYSDYIPVIPGEVLYFGEVYATASSAGTAFYDSNQVYVSGFSATNLKGSNGVKTVPEGVAFMRHSWLIEEGYNENWETTVYIILNSSPHEFTPYANICPISGRTGLDVYAGPTSAIGDATTYSMDWTSPAGTVYAGSADIVTGDIKAAPYYASYNGETLVGPWVSSMDEYDPQGTPTTGAQVVDLGGTMTKYHITGQDIITLVGDNYIWSDSGDVTITE